MSGWSTGSNVLWIITYVEDSTMTYERYMSDIRRELAKEDEEIRE